MADALIGSFDRDGNGETRIDGLPFFVRLLLCGRARLRRRFRAQRPKRRITWARSIAKGVTPDQIIQFSVQRHAARIGSSEPVNFEIFETRNILIDDSARVSALFETGLGRAQYTLQAIAIELA